MNYKMIRYTLGILILFEALFLIVPAITAVVYSEWNSLIATAISMGICLVIGIPLSFKKPKNTKLFAKDGFVIVSLSWIALTAFGALPLVFSGSIPNYIDAFFEAASGFTTTGSSVIPAVEALPKSMLMWRSFMHWVGGMGVLVFIMAIMPLSGAQNMHIMRAESPGPQVSKLVPRVRRTAMILYLIYIVMTVITFLLLLFDKEMTAFEAINTSLATAGTGGFGFRNDSMYSFSSYVIIIITVFMLLFAINFNSYYLILKGKFKEAFNSEVLVFLGAVIAIILLITLNVYLDRDRIVAEAALRGTPGLKSDYTFFNTLKHVAFTVASIVSTTGFCTVDFDVWPVFSKFLVIFLTFMGACAGSTGGGFKVSRLIIIVKNAFREIGNLIRPNQVKKISIDDKAMDEVAVKSVVTYFSAYALFIMTSLLIVCVDQAIFRSGEATNTLVTNFTAVMTTINNVGPGLEAVGPTCNFAHLPYLSKIVLSFNMIAGRLELFPMLILFAPSTWKNN